MRTLGVLIAGGAGRRLAAGRPKALARLGGRTLIERAMAILYGVADEVVVAAPSHRALPIPSESRVNDLPRFEGPLSGLVAGLGARAYERAIVLGVDFPFVRPAALRAIVDHLQPPAIAVVPAPQSRPQPFLAVYAPAAHSRLLKRLEAGERSATAAVLSLQPHLLDDEAVAQLEGGAENFFNVNTRDDLERAERMLVRSTAS